MPPPRQSVEGRGPTGLNRTRKGQGLTATAGQRRPDGDPTKGLETEGKTPHRNAGHLLPPGLALPTPRFVGLRVGTMDAGYRMRDAGSGCKPRYARWARSSVFGPRPWRDEGQGRCDLPTSFLQAEGREPKAGHRIRYPVPVTCLRKTTHEVCMMHTRCARFPGSGLGLRCSVSGPRC